MRQSEFVELFFGDEFIIVVYGLGVLFFEFFGKSVQESTPFGRGTETLEYKFFVQSEQNVVLIQR